MSAQRFHVLALQSYHRKSHVVSRPCREPKEPATEARCGKAHIVLSYPSGRDFERGSAQPPELMTSAAAGTVQSSGSLSQPSGRATRAGEPCLPRGPLPASGKAMVPSN